MATTVEVRVAANTDDIECYWDPSVWVVEEDTVIVFGYYWANSKERSGGGFRFLNVTIPNGATITAAYITFIPYTSTSNTTVNLRITGELGTTATFSDLANYIARRGTIVGGADDTNITTAQVDWDNLAAWTAESTYNTPSIVSIVQEIVNATWSSGDDMTLFVDDHDNRTTNTNETQRNPYNHNRDSAKAPLLHVEYTVGWTGKVIGVTDPAKVLGVAVANIATVSGVS